MSDAPIKRHPLDEGERIILTDVPVGCPEFVILNGQRLDLGKTYVRRDGAWHLQEEQSHDPR